MLVSLHLMDCWITVDLEDLVDKQCSDNPLFQPCNLIWLFGQQRGRFKIMSGGSAKSIVYQTLKQDEIKIEAICLLGNPCYIIIPIDFWDFTKAKEYWLTVWMTILSKCQRDMIYIKIKIHLSPLNTVLSTWQVLHYSVNDTSKNIN